MTIQALEKAIENLEYKVSKLEFEVYEQRRTIGQLIMEKADRKTEPRTITIEGKMSLNEWRKICPENPQFKDEPQTEAWHDDCNTCRWHDGACTIPCCDYEPKTDPQTLDDIGKQIQDAYDKGLLSDADAVQAWYEAIKTAPQSDARKFLGYVCETCKHRDEEWDSKACDGCCENDDHYEPQTDIGTSDTVYSDTAGYVPRVDMTDCSWKKGE